MIRVGWYIWAICIIPPLSSLINSQHGGILEGGNLLASHHNHHCHHCHHNPGCPTRVVVLYFGLSVILCVDCCALCCDIAVLCRVLTVLYFACCVVDSMLCCVILCLARPFSKTCHKQGCHMAILLLLRNTRGTKYILDTSWMRFRLAFSDLSSQHFLLHDKIKGGANLFLHMPDRQNCTPDQIASHTNRNIFL